TFLGRRCYTSSGSIVIQLVLPFASKFLESNEVTNAFFIIVQRCAESVKTFSINNPSWNHLVRGFYMWIVQRLSSKPRSLVSYEQLCLLFDHPKQSL
ncbi:unnamed protein product, partial [Cylicocyclus nassatus]